MTYICSWCNGSGEGVTERSTCSKCGGTGEEWVEDVEEEGDEE